MRAFIIVFVISIFSLNSLAQSAAGKTCSIDEKKLALMKRSIPCLTAASALGCGAFGAGAIAAGLTIPKLLRDQLAKAIESQRSKIVDELVEGILEESRAANFVGGKEEFAKYIGELEGDRENLLKERERLLAELDQAKKNPANSLTQLERTPTGLKYRNLLAEGLESSLNKLDKEIELKRVEIKDAKYQLKSRPGPYYRSVLNKISIINSNGTAVSYSNLLYEDPKTVPKKFLTEERKLAEKAFQYVVDGIKSGKDVFAKKFVEGAKGPLELAARAVSKTGFDKIIRNAVLNAVELSKKSLAGSRVLSSRAALAASRFGATQAGRFAKAGARAGLRVFGIVGAAQLFAYSSDAGACEFNYVNGTTENGCAPGEPVLSDNVVAFLGLPYEDQLTYLKETRGACEFYEKIFDRYSAGSYTFEKPDCIGTSINLTVKTKERKTYKQRYVFTSDPNPAKRRLQKIITTDASGNEIVDNYTVEGSLNRTGNENFDDPERIGIINSQLGTGIAAICQADPQEQACLLSQFRSITDRNRDCGNYTNSNKNKSSNGTR